MNDLGDKYIVSSFLGCAELTPLTSHQLAFRCCTSDEPFVLVDEMIIGSSRIDRSNSTYPGDFCHNRGQMPDFEREKFSDRVPN